MGRAVPGWRRGTAELDPAVVEEYWKHSFWCGGKMAAARWSFVAPEARFITGSRKTYLNLPAASTIG